jgi:hypothetical protein
MRFIVCFVLFFSSFVSICPRTALRHAHVISETVTCYGCGDQGGNHGGCWQVGEIWEADKRIAFRIRHVGCLAEAIVENPDKWRFEHLSRCRLPSTDITGQLLW